MKNQFTIFDNISTGVMVIDWNYRVQFWNKIIESWTKITKDEIYQKDIRIIFNHFSLLKYTTRLESTFNYGTPVVFSSQLHRQLIPCKLPNGHLRLQHSVITAHPAENKKNKYYAIFSIQDVTELTEKANEYKRILKLANTEIAERQKAETELKNSEKKYRMMVDNSMDAIVIIQNNKFIFFNESFEKLIDIEKSQIKSCTFESIQTNGTVIKFDEIVNKYEKSINNDVQELQFSNKTNKNIFIEAKIKKIEFEGNTAFFAIFKDITFQKKLLEKVQDTLKNTIEQKGLIPICASCKKIRDENIKTKPWVEVEEYVAKYLTEAHFTHGICPDCITTLYPHLNFANK